MKIITTSKAITLAALATFVFPSCNSTDATKGAGLGAAGGAALGGIIGHQSGKGIEGALIGGGVGAITGGLIGNESDKKKQDSYSVDIFSSC